MTAFLSGNKLIIFLVVNLFLVQQICEDQLAVDESRQREQGKLYEASMAAAMDDKVRKDNPKGNNLWNVLTFDIVFAKLF